MINTTFPSRLISFIKKNNFLPQDSDISSSFAGTDTKKKYEESLKSEDRNWFYRENPIQYELNKQKYRAPDFNSIDWANSIVVFGCSNVFGLGLHTEDTITQQLEKITGINVVNMGAPGSSMKFSLYNSIILSNGFPTPKAVVQVWTHPDRIPLFRRFSVTNQGSWNKEKHSYFSAFAQVESNIVTNAILDSMTCKNVWSSRTKYYECTLFGKTHDVLQCDYHKIVDVARDLIHPGRITSRTVAESIAKNLNL